MNNIILLFLVLFLGACSKNADMGKLPGTKDPTNIRPIDPVTEDLAAQLEWSQPLILFPATTVNQSQEVVVSLKNKGKGPSSPIQLTWADTASKFTIKSGTNNCDNVALQPNQSCSLTLVYTPVENGNKTNVMMATDLISSKTLMMAGVGIGGPTTSATSPAKLVWILDDYDYGSTPVGGNKHFDLTLANIGGEVSDIIETSWQSPTSIFTTVAGFNFCENQTLSPGANCKVRVRFAPVVSGNFVNIFRVTDNISNDAIQLSGSAVIIPSQLSFNPTSYSFNQTLVGGQKTLDVVLRNNATVNSGVIAFSWDNNQNFSIVSGLDQCSGQVLPGGAQCSLKVRFNPETVNSDLSNSLTADDGFSTATLSLQGAGQDPASNYPVAINRTISAAEDIVTNENLQAMDPNGLAITYILAGSATKGNVVILNANTGSFRYTPDLNATGADSFTFRVKNSNNDMSAIATVSINIIAINDSPVAVNDNISVNEDNAINIPVLVNDSDIEGNILSVGAITQPANGVVIINGDNTIRYTPHLNYSGTDSFVYTLSDGAGGTTTAMVYITVTPVNDTPIAVNSTFNLNEDSSLNAQMQGSDVDSSSVVYSITTAPTKGTLTITNNTGSFNYVPNPDYNGSDNFSFKINDGTVDSNIGVVTIAVNPVNDLPVTNNMVLHVVEDTPKVFILDASDKENDTLTYSILTEPTKGTLSGTAPNLTYTPNGQYHGMDTITYQVADSFGNSNISSINIVVWPVNDIPVAFENNFSISEDSITTNRSLTATDSDGDSLIYSIVSQPTKGTLVLLNSATGAYSYTPNLNATGADSFSFKVFDGTVESDVATISININSVLDIPVANNINIQTLKDQSYNGSFSYTHIESTEAVTFSSSQPSNGTVTVTDPDTGTFTYTPNSGYNGADSFTYQITTAYGTSNTATVAIIVSETNVAPVASDSSISVTEDVVYNGSVSATDADNNALTYTIVTQSSKGVVSINSSTGAIVFTPTLNANGSDSFSYRVNDGLINSNTATVSISITPVNDAPVAIAKVESTSEETPVAITLTGTDIEGSSLTYFIVANPTKGVLSGTAPNLTYTPNSNQTGSDFFTYKVNDGTVDSSTVIVSIVIAGTNDLAVANNGSFTTNEDTTYNGTVVATDADGDSLNYSIVTQGSKGVVSINAVTGAYIYTPNLNANGSDSFTYRVFDGTGNSNTATVSGTINPVNDAPVANNSSFIAQEDTTYNGTLSATDIEGNSLTYSMVSQPSNGVVVLNSTTGSYTYKANQNYTGSDSFTFKVNDGTIDSNTATASITVQTNNNLPVANNFSFTTNEDTGYNGTVTASDSDNDTLTYSIVVNGAKGVATINASTGAIIYTPTLNTNGTDFFTFRVNDGTGNSNTATVSVTITPVNDAPVAMADSVSTNRNTPVNVILSGTDIESSPLTYTIISSPTKGVVSGTAPNIVYTPNNNQTGADSLTFRVNDGALNSNTATISINVVNSNQLPVANNNSLVATEDTVANGLLSATDGDSDALTYSIVNQATKGVVTITNTATGAYTYTPTLNANGSDSFTFKVNDGYGNSNNATITVNIAPINDTPIANGQSGINVLQNTAKAITLTGSDVDGDALTYVIVAAPTKGTVSGTGANKTYTPNTNTVGADSFTYRVNDGVANSSTVTVSLSIQDMGEWFNTSWLYRRKIHINNQRFAAQSEVPVMVKLDSSRIDYSKTKSGGADLRFTDNAGNLLSYEIERWNAAGVSTVWVKIPTLAANSMTGFFWMYYGNSAVTDAQNVANVWSNGYVAVYHLEETTGLPQDSTGVNHASSVLGSINRNIAGKAAGGEGFGASTADVIKIPNSTSLNITNQVSIEAWVYKTANSSEAILIEKNAASYGNYSLRLHNGVPKFRQASKSVSMTAAIPDNKWTYVASTFNSVTNSCQLYSSESDLYTSSTGCSDALTGNTNNITIGGDDSQSGSHLKGTIDEVRISNVERTADWINIQYKSVSDGLLIYGSEQSHSNPLLKSMITAIASTNNDGEVNEADNRDVNKNSMGEKTNNVWGFFRFKYQSAIPASATITNSRLFLFGKNFNGWNSGTHYLSIRGEKTSNASQLTGNDQCPGCSTNKITTTANTSWGSPGLNWDIGGWNTSSNFNNITQELVSTYSGLTQNNYMQLWVTRGYDFTGTSTYEVEAADYGDNFVEPQLLIEWTQ